SGRFPWLQAQLGAFLVPKRSSDLYRRGGDGLEVPFLWSSILRPKDGDMNLRPALPRRVSRPSFISARFALFALVVLASLFLVSASSPSGSGLVAAYSFDEGTGTTAADASGNGHAATLLSAGWDTGQSGSAVSLDGSNGSVSLPSLGTF